MTPARRFLLAVLLQPLAVLSVGAQIVSRPLATQMTLGHGRAVIRDLHIVEFRHGQQELRFRSIPSEADLSSLVVRAERVPVDLVEWQRPLGGAAGATAGRDPSLRHDARSDVVRWQPQVVTSQAVEQGSEVRCMVFCPLPGRREVEVIYHVPGFDWEARYRIGVRPSEADQREVVSADVTGVIKVTNPTDRRFTEAQMRLVGGAVLRPPAPPEEPGILVLDAGNPIRSLEPPVESEAVIPYTYRVPMRATLAPHSVTLVPIAEAPRTPARRLYLLRADAFPIGAGPARPLRKLLVIENREEHGLGRSLPPGRVQVFLGGRRGHLLQEGRLPRTSPGGELRVDLGHSDAVRGRRRLERTGVLEGVHEEVVEVLVENRLDSAIRVEVNDKPPSREQWEVIGSSDKFDVRDQRVLFHPEVPAQTEYRLTYRLRVRERGF